MKTNFVSLSFKGLEGATMSCVKKANQSIWNSNPKMARDYTNDINIALTNTIYNMRKGIGEHAPAGYGAVAKLFNIKNFIKLGGESAVFSLNNGDILKISVREYSPYNSELHAPEILRGSIKTPELYSIFSFLKNIKTNMFYYLIQEKGEMHVAQEDKDNLLNKALKAGYKLWDIKWDQFAYFNINGKREARFIDMGCLLTEEEEF